jgi:transcriptional regulator with XRE-family HTH domain
MQPGSGLEILSAEQGAQRLGVSAGTLIRWARSNLLAARLYYAFDVYLDAEEVERFRADYMFSEDAAPLLGLQPLDLELWYQDWGLEVTRGMGTNGRPVFLFRREDVERLSVELDAEGEREEIHHSH